MGSLGRVAQIWRYPFKSMGGERLEASRIGPGGIPGDRGWAVRDEAVGEIRGAKHIPRLLLCQARYLEEPAGDSIPHVEIRLPGGVMLRSDDPGAAARLSEFLGRAVTLWPLQPASDADHYRRRRPLGDEAELREFLSRQPDEPMPDLSAIPQELVEFTSPRGTYFDAAPLHLLTTASFAALGSRNPGARLDVRRFRPNIYIETPAGVEGFVELAWRGQAVRMGGARLECAGPATRCGMTAAEQPGLVKDASILRTIERQADQHLGIYASPAGPGDVETGDEVLPLDAWKT